MDKNFNEVTDRIIMMSGIDIFKNTRVNEYIEMRALTCFILHKKLHMGYSKIARNFKSKGKKNGSRNCYSCCKKISNLQKY